jgi:hypothetical protein
MARECHGAGRIAPNTSVAKSNAAKRDIPRKVIASGKFND